jgi:hypothetical protein
MQGSVMYHDGNRQLQGVFGLTGHHHTRRAQATNRQKRRGRALTISKTMSIRVR